MKNERLLAPLLLTLLATLPIHAQGPTDPTLHDFEADGEYDLFVDGQRVPDAEIARAGHLPAYLIQSKSLAVPVLLRPREAVAQAVPAAAVVRRADGMIDLAAGAKITTIGPLAVESDSASFKQDGKTWSLRPKAPLLGLRSAADIESYNPTFRRRADRYTPNADAVKALRAVKRRVVVHVVFGSWCPHCQAKIPLLLRTERELKGSSIAVEYFGLPRPPEAWSSPEAQRLQVNSVPMAVVSIDGVEAGRILSSAWDAPEVLLARIVGLAGTR